MRPRRICSVLLLTAFVAAACGGSDEGTSDNAAAASRPLVTIGPATEMTPCPGGHSPALFALDPTNGGLQWTHCLEGRVNTTVLGATDDTVYAVATDPSTRTATFVAIDAADGTRRWEVAVARQQWPAGPMAARGVVVLVVGTELVGFDATTGQRRWGVPAADGSPIAHTDALVVVSTTSRSTDPTKPPAGTVRGIDRTNGQERWTVALRVEDNSGVMVGRAAPAVDDGLVMIPRGSELVALDATNGRQRWTGFQLDHPAAADGVVVGGVGSRATVTAADTTNGKTLWTGTGRPAYGDIWVLGDGAVYVVDRGVVALDARTGATRWRQDSTKDLGAEPWAARPGVVFVGWEGVVSALSATDGTARWTVRPALVRPGWMTGLVLNSRSAVVAVDNFAPTD